MSTQEIAKTTITLDQIKPLLPTKTYLTYIDRDESLDGREELIQRCIKENNFDALYEFVDENIWEKSADQELYYKDELKDDIVKSLGVSEEEAEEVVDQFNDEIIDIIHDRDDSTPMKDLIRNSRKLTVFYDTGYEVEAESWCWSEKRVNQEVKDIKRVLKLRIGDNTYDEYIANMVRQASYGGNLVVYFNEDIDFFFERNTEGMTHIEFSNPIIAIINTTNGSGDHCHLPGAKTALPLVHKNFFLCKTFNYSYTFSVCGMYDNWCEVTDATFIKKKSAAKSTVKASPLTAVVAEEQKYIDTFKSGSCTRGDVNYSRHRNVVYTNNYPCGHTCKTCGQFWID